MSQEQQIGNSNSVVEPMTIQPWSMDNFANQLMDELFEDIDRMLDGGTPTKVEPEKTEYVSLEPVSVDKVTLPPDWVPPAELLAPPPEEKGMLVPTLEPDLPPAPMTIARAEIVPDEFRYSIPPDNSPRFDYILLGMAGVSVTAAIGLWMINQNLLSWPKLGQSPAATTVAIQQASPADRQFATYLQRSLEVIERKAKAKPSPQGTPANTMALNPPGMALPAAPNQPNLINPGINPGAIASVPNPQPQVLERVYIPIYQTPPPGNPAMPNLNSVPLPNPPLAAAPTLKPPSPPQPPIPATVPASIPSPVAAVAPLVPGTNHTLVGIIEFGDRSAALFDIGGTTRRVQMGESIGSSGWTLVSVNGQEAIVRRNGEVRSVYVGQKF